MKCRHPEIKHDLDDITGTAKPPFIHQLSSPPGLCNEQTFHPKPKLHHPGAVGYLHISAENEVSSEALSDGDSDQPIRERYPFGQSYKPWATTRTMFCLPVNLYYSGDFQATACVTHWKALISHLYNQSSKKKKIVRTPSSATRTLVSFDLSPYNDRTLPFT